MSVVEERKSPEDLERSQARPDSPSKDNDVDSSVDANSLKAKQIGVLGAEAAKQVAGWRLWTLYVGIALTAYVAGLDNNTTFAYQQAGASAFLQYPLYASVISVLQQVIIAVGKFPVAKLSDVFGRAEGFMVSLACFLIGWIMMAGAQNFSTLVAATVFYAFGNTGTQIMQQIIIADYIPSKWRGLAIGLLSFPYIINFAVAGKITGQLVDYTDTTSNTWRWGPGSFAIVMPIAMAPLILSLALSQHRAKKDGLVPRHPYRAMRPMQGLRAFLSDMDFGCLILISAGFILILLPLGLYAYAAKLWASPHIIVMFVVGGLCLIGIGLWEWLVASKPLLRLEYFLNRDIIIPALGIGFFDFWAFYMSFTPAYSWSIVAKDFSVEDATYYSVTQSLCLTVFGIACGAIMRWTRHYKYLLTFGCCIRLLGIGLMMRYRTEGSSTVQIVFPQVLQGLGGGFMGITLQVAAQVSVRHQFVAMVLSFVLLFTEIGGACGTAVLGTLQSKYLLPEMLQRLGAVGVSAADINALYAAPTTAIPWPLGSPERTAYIEAWNVYLHVGLSIAAGLSAVPIIASLFITNRRLGDGQNEVSDEMAPGHLGSAQEPPNSLREDKEAQLVAYPEIDGGKNAVSNSG